MGRAGGRYTDRTSGAATPRLFGRADGPAEAEDATSAEILAEVLAGCSDAITIVDVRGRILFCNEAALAGMEIADPGLVRGRMWPGFWSGAAAAAAETAVARAAEGEASRFAGEMRGANGDLSPREVRVTPLRDAEGQPVRALAIARDAAGPQAAERLRQSEACLSAILQQLPLGIGVLDVTGRLTLSNEAFRRYAMGEQGEGAVTGALGHGWRAVRADGLPVPAAAHPVARALRGETAAEGMEVLRQWRNGPGEGSPGNDVWLMVRAVPLRDRHGAASGAVMIVEDIDQAKRGAIALRESEARFRRFAKHSTDLLWILNVEAGRIEYLNPESEAIPGWPAAALPAELGRWSEAIHPDDRAEAMAAFERMKGGEAGEREFRIVRPDGMVRWIRSTWFPIRDEHGRLRQVGGIAEDITRQGASQVYLVGADEAARLRLVPFLQAAGHEVKAFASAREVLEVAGVLVPGCIVLDTEDAAACGLAVPRELKARHIGIPVIAVGSSRGEARPAVEAMKAGAVDWLEAPCGAKALRTAVASALAGVREAMTGDRAASLARTQIAEMSSREREVLAGLMAGGTNKSLARRLGISPRTVEIHRARVMERLGAHSLSEAVLLAARAGMDTGDGGGPAARGRAKGR